MAIRFHGVFYSTIQAAPNGHKAVVSVWLGGRWQETLVSPTPLATRGAAWGEASKLAMRKGQTTGLRIKSIDHGPQHRLHVAVPVALAA